MSLIVIENGDLFQSKMPVWVNAVNCRGFMGVGIARKFADLFPDYLANYKARCRHGAIVLGQVDLYTNPDGPDILSFPTMNFPGELSSLYYIQRGLRSLRNMVTSHDIQGLAIPALGCGVGRLPWLGVEASVKDMLGDLNIPIELYAPLKG